MKKTKLLLSFLIAIIIVILTISGLTMQAVNNPSRNKQIIVACVGDSITSGFGYPEGLQELLGKNYVVYNFGSGGTTISLDSEAPYMVEPVFTQAKASDPDIVVIMLGTNDAGFELQQYSGNFVSDYITLISEFQKTSGKTKIWIVKPPPIFSDSLGLNPEYFRQSIIPKIDEVAIQKGLPIIDVYSPLIGDSNKFYDGVHPTIDGSKLIANMIYQRLIIS